MHDFISRSKLQRRSQSNSTDIFQLNLFPGEIFSDWDFLEIGKKGRIIWIGNGAYYWPLVVGRNTLYTYLEMILLFWSKHNKFC